MAKVIIHSLFEQKLHEYVEEAYELLIFHTSCEALIS